MRKILIISAIAAGAAICTVAIGGETLSNSTRQDLLTAMKSEGLAHLKYTLFAEQARKNGNEVLAGIFEHTADDEFEKHFKTHAKLYGLLKSDYENLLNAMSAEFVESTQMYQEMAKRAEAAGDADAAKHFADFARDELEHRDIFKAAIPKQTK
ncbi:MAG TPA: ferritin family protein [Geobacterales bacterium]|jgi:rubrerythrin|nr:ferritin family protein [Geobacterales bacterium]